MTDERPNSLAAQAASWVPPWERPQPPLDRDYAASVRDQDIADDPADPDDPDAASSSDDPGSDGSPRAALDEPDSAGHGDDDEQRDESQLSDDDDDFDEEFEQPNPPSYQPSEGVPAELAPLPGESPGIATVDAPAETDPETDPEQFSPTDVGIGPDLEVPSSIEDAAEHVHADEDGDPVDAPLPPDGADAGDVFDQAADDDMSDDAEVDMPFAEEVPAADETPDDATADDETPEDASAVDVSPDDVTPDGESAADTTAPAAAIPGQKSRRRAKAVAEPAARTADDVDVDELPPIDDTELRAALEAILLVVDEPVAEMQLAQIMEQPTERVATMLEDISARFTAQGHGFDLRRAAGGWRLYTRPEYAPYVERFVLDGQSVRLTQAALETLAVVAYKQPVTRSRISVIRGVNCDGVMRTLTTRGLIEECGTEGETGAYLYRTTGLFLEKLGLNSVDQLPPLAPFLPDDVEEVLDASG